jgi:phosphate transport system permease protein
MTQIADAEMHAEISRPPSRAQRWSDVVFRGLCYGFGCLCVVLVAFIVLRIATAAIPAIRQYGLGFLTGTTWDPNKDQFGILPEIWGTLYSSVLALIIGTIFGVAAALFLYEARRQRDTAVGVDDSADAPPSHRPAAKRGSPPRGGG